MKKGLSRLAAFQFSSHDFANRANAGDVMVGRDSPISGDAAV